MMSADVVGLGFAAMDILLDTEDLPKEDGFSFVHKESLMPGGSCANAMVAVSGLGGSSRLIAKMGNDHYGRAFIRDLEMSGVLSDLVSVRQGGTSLHNFIAVTKNGAKAMFSNLGDSLLSLTEDEVHGDMLRGAKVFYNELIPARPALKLARSCKETGIPIFFNLQVGPGLMELCGISRAEIEEMLGICDLFITNQGLVPDLAGRADCMEGARHLKEVYDFSTGIIVTRGKEGAFFLGHDTSIIVPGLDVRAVDTTGAGDSFSGGFMYSRFIKGLGIKESLEFANGCAALKCTQYGPRLKAREADIIHFIKGLGE